MSVDSAVLVAQCEADLNWLLAGLPDGETYRYAEPHESRQQSLRMELRSALIAYRRQGQGGGENMLVAEADCALRDIAEAAALAERGALAAVLERAREHVSRIRQVADGGDMSSPHVQRPRDALRKGQCLICKCGGKRGKYYAERGTCCLCHCCPQGSS